MKYDFHHKQNYFLDYFTDPVPNYGVIYAADIPFQYNKRESEYTEVVGYPTGIIFVGNKKDHSLLLNQTQNASNLSSNSNKFRQSNATENSRNFIQIAPANPTDMSLPMYSAQKRDADADYICGVKITIGNCIHDINLVYPVNIGKVHEDLMNQLRNEDIHISTKYNVQGKSLTL